MGSGPFSYDGTSSPKVTLDPVQGVKRCINVIYKVAIKDLIVKPYLG